MAEDNGRVAVITGGASGIGHACARRFAAAGDLVVLADRDRDTAAEVVRELTGAGGRAAWQDIDVADEASVAAAVAAVEARHGTVGHVATLM